MNYYISLYVLKDKENKIYFLLYGFVVEIDNAISSNWHEKCISRRLKLYRLIYVTDIEGYKRFINNISGFKVNNYCIYGKFMKRDKIISGVDYSFNKNKPTNKLSDLVELWNMNKYNLIDNIRRLYFNKENIEKEIRELLNILYEKIGINFLQDSYRFGNLEVYKIYKYNSLINVGFKNGNKEVIISLKKSLKNDIYIKLHCENNKRTILNKLKVLKKGETEISFLLNEKSYHILVEIWDNNGDLIYFLNNYYMGEVNINFNSMDTQYRLEDKFSEQIKQSSKHNVDDIEVVNPINSTYNIVINSYEEDLISKIIYKSQSLFDNYKKKESQGKFILNKSDKSGEVNSYKLIKNLIDSKQNDSVIILDPYFSIESVSKIMSRIEHRNIDIIVVVSLTEEDPDTGKKKKNYKSKFKNFILKNKNILHKKLKVINVLSGSKEAFHDRYLIRYCKNNKIEGYILSNSINSMGQKYPFLVSPIETQVLEEILIYIKKLTGSLKSKEKYYRNLKREVIYDGTKYIKETKKTYMLPYVLTKEEDLEKAFKISKMKGYIKSSRYYSINEEKYEEVIDIILENWTNNKEETIISIGELIRNSTLSQIEVDNFIFKKLSHKKIEEEEFIEELKKVAKNIEHRIDFLCYEPNSIERNIYLLLNDEDKIEDFKNLYNKIRTVDYGDCLSILYQILYKYSFDEYIQFLEETKSPLMYTELIKYINLTRINSKKYKRLIISQIPGLSYFGAYWLLDEYLKYNEKIDVIIFELNKLEDVHKLSQGSIILSKLIFEYSITRNLNKEDILFLIEEISNMFNDSDLDSDIKFSYIKKIKNLNILDEFKLKSHIINYITDENLLDLVVLDLIEKFIKEYKTGYAKLYDNPALIEYFLKVISFNPKKYLDIFYKNSNFGNVIYKLREPLLEEINFMKWHNLKNIYLCEYSIWSKLKNSGYNVKKYDDLFKDCII